jgi:flagella basal body P-ring formation protein FlgA
MPLRLPAKSITRLLTATALCAGVATAAGASALPPDAVAQALDLAREGAKALAPAGARIEAHAGALDSRLRLAPCARVQPFLLAGASPWGKSRVGLRCLEGPVAWQVQLPVTVQVWARAAVAAAPLPAGAQLEASEMQLLETDWATSPGRPFVSVEELSGRVLVRPLAAGVPVRPADLRPRQWFAQGDTVQILALGRGFSVSAEGQALAPGFEGQPVRVRTEAGRVVVAVPVAQRRVELTL